MIRTNRKGNSPRPRRSNQSTPPHGTAAQVAAKTVTYRVITTVQSFALAWLLFGDITAGGAFALLDNVISGGLYAGFEIAWVRAFGRPQRRGFSRNRRRFLTAR